ncbi:MAG: serine hydrolase [Myxococcota bacterium]|nr:serine hydrolase [Myxococcota bacterium]
MTRRSLATLIACLALLIPLTACELDEPNGSDLARSGPDRDGDGIPDATDVCPRVADPAQRDSDRDGRGDACSCGDLDANGVVDWSDLALSANCAEGGMACPGLCDATADGACDSADTLQIGAYLLGDAELEALACDATQDLIDPAVASGLIVVDPGEESFDPQTRETDAIYMAREMVRDDELLIAIDAGSRQGASNCVQFGCGSIKVSNGVDGTAEYPFGPFTQHDWHPAIGPALLSSTLTSGNFRVVEIEPAESLVDGVFSALYVRNTGEHMAADHHFVHDATEAELSDLQQHYRFTSLRPYMTPGGLRFAASMIDDDKNWSWRFGYSLSELEDEMEALGHRFIDIERYVVGGQEQWAGVAIANTGNDERTSEVRRFATPDAARLWHASWPESRFVDIERDGTEIVAILSSAAPGEPAVENVRDSWIHFDVSQGDVGHLVRRHGGRVIDIDPLGGGRYDVLLVDNGTLKTGTPKPGYGVFDDLIIDKMKRYGLPGATFALSANGNLVYARGYGYADIGKNQLATPDTLIRIGSISKAVTAVAVMRLLENGAVIPGSGGSGWVTTDPSTGGGGTPVTLQTLIFRDVICPHFGRQCPNLTSITLEDLLRHEGGWYEQQALYPGDDFDNWLPLNMTETVAQGLGMEHTPRCKQVLEHFLPRPLDVQPGTKYYYSGLGICAAAVAVEILSGQTIRQFVEDEVAGPLELNDGKTRFAYSPDRYADKVSLEARHYDPFGQPKVTPKVIEWAEDFNADGWPLFGDQRVPAAYGGTPQYSIVPAGGWSASAVAMLRIATALQHDRHPYVLSYASTSLFPTPGVPKPNGGNRGLGWDIAGTDGIAHGGSVAGGSAYLRIGGSDVDGISWVVLFNGQPYPDMGGITNLVKARKDLILSHTWDLFPQYGFEEPDVTPLPDGPGDFELEGRDDPFAGIQGVLGGSGAKLALP